jgi:hypothetical protein
MTLSHLLDCDLLIVSLLSQRLKSQVRRDFQAQRTSFTAVRPLFFHGLPANISLAFSISPDFSDVPFCQDNPPVLFTFIIKLLTHRTVLGLPDANTTRLAPIIALELRGTL